MYLAVTPGPTLGLNLGLGLLGSLNFLIFERSDYLSKELVPITCLGEGQIENPQGRTDLQ